jgi:hypothetical protein
MVNARRRFPPISRGSDAAKQATRPDFGCDVSLGEALAAFLPLIPNGARKTDLRIERFATPPNGVT